MIARPSVTERALTIFCTRRSMSVSFCPELIPSGSTRAAIPSRGVVTGAFDHERRVAERRRGADLVERRRVCVQVRARDRGRGERGDERDARRHRNACV